MNLGNLLKQKRIEKGLTLAQAGRLIGVSKVTYRDYELNKIAFPRIDKAKRLADFLEISLDELFKFFSNMFAK